MKLRVAKMKTSNTANKTELYFQNADKRKELENKENVREQSEEDTDLILDEFEENNESNDECDMEAVEDEDNVTKIYISSRTHSQLSQFIGEIKRTVFKNGTRVVTLASRQHYCINSEVKRLKNVNLINERCLELQKSKSKPTSVGEDGQVMKKSKTKSCTGCPYYNQNNIVKLKEQMLVDIMDMEDLVKCSKELKACPYYASRMALDDAEVVLISHAGIVSAGARSGVSLKLKDNILILDEAHGLTAALENAHSAPVSYKQLSSVKTFLQFYINKYRARLSSKNLLSLNQITFIVGKLLGVIKPKTQNERKQELTTIYTLEDFVIKAEIDHLNLRPLVEFCRSTRLAPKLHGFSMRYNQQMLEEDMKKTVVKNSSFEAFINKISKKKVEEVVEVKPEKKPIAQMPSETSAGSGLYAMLDFLQMLCDRSENGRVLARSGDDGNLKYLLLNPAEHFADVVTQCRSVIVAGGTMEPISEFRNLLTVNIDKYAQINVVRCDHVVPPDNVLAVCLSKGPSNLNLNFSYENRKKNELVLHKFAVAVKNKERHGALLFSVVGGKLSEGLNFSDDLGRCVMVIGMPYPNVKSPELQEKMNYMNETVGGGAGSIYYENLCMKVVNQCIGRAVRHANDYASVILVDERYSRPQTMAALPSFVQKSLISNCTFGPTIGSIAKFFSRHKDKTK
ncbi:ATP-dependent DNA helicase DDX11 [Hyposmocoma kahamanoa]|uniref:ATP-dependent DNA helicase DDX11 n=1 Tax=Hyposmocoma kahamanoa TaxID=1477025 RepID=UPI000E6D5F02|nr:ATP-dependent DNA helicase DDX11 [Hyposmocoma kahamanoa]